MTSRYSMFHSSSSGDYMVVVVVEEEEEEQERTRETRRERHVVGIYCFDCDEMTCCCSRRIAAGRPMRAVACAAVQGPIHGCRECAAEAMMMKKRRRKKRRVTNAGRTCEDAQVAMLHVARPCAQRSAI